MNPLSGRIGFWSAVVLTVLVILIDVGMILSTLLFPMTTVTNIDSYAALFTSFQMLPFVPSLILAPVFVMLMVSIHNMASEDKKILTQLASGFSLVCAAILSLHYYIQLTVIQQGILNHETNGLWQYVTPNPHSFFWTFAALGYGFMGISLLSAAPVFTEKSDRIIKWLFIANGVIGVSFLIGNAMGIFIINIFASLIWGVLFPITALLLAKKFRGTRA